MNFKRFQQTSYTVKLTANRKKLDSAGILRINRVVHVYYALHKQGAGQQTKVLFFFRTKARYIGIYSKLIGGMPMHERFLQQNIFF